MGFQSLPKLNSRDESWREFLCGENGHRAHWLRLGADGWRLDVVDEYPDELVRMIRQAARAEKPDALIIGEVWEDASCKEAYGEHRQYLMGHELDSVMNYPLRQTILDFLLRGDGAAFRLRLWELLEHYPRPCWDVMMNLLSSHDVPRAITALGGTPMQHRDRDWQRAHNTLTVAQYYRGRQLFMLGTLMTMTLPGMPCLYYGDEAGLVGYADPFNRGTYPWGRETLACGSASGRWPPSGTGTVPFPPANWSRWCARLAWPPGAAGMKPVNLSSASIPGRGRCPCPMPPSTAKRYSP